MEAVKRYLVIVTADGNDGDDADRTTEVTENQLKLVRKVAKAVKNFESGPNRRSNWTRGLDIRPDWPEGTEHTVEEKYAGVLTPDEIQDWEDEYMPWNNECEGNHTIRAIHVIEFTSMKDLLK